MFKLLTILLLSQVQTDPITDQDISNELGIVLEDFRSVKSSSECNLNEIYDKAWMVCIKYNPRYIDSIGELGETNEVKVSD